MNDDVTDILRSWPYEGEGTVRIINGNDGRQLLQIRLPMGIEQYELDGRPDGKAMGPTETYLDLVEKQLASEGPEAYSLGHDIFLLLQTESVLYYYRYLHLFQLGDYIRTVRDTDHNLRVCDLVEQYAEDDKDKMSMLQYKPYILRINGIARAMIALNAADYTDAERILSETLLRVSEMKDAGTAVFKIEKIRSIRQLKSFLSQVEGRRQDPLTALEAELKRAVEEEDYEYAAEIRDRIQERTAQYFDSGT